MALEFNYQDALGFHQMRDGTFTCSGVKNGTDDHCGWNLTKPNSRRISGILRSMSTQPPMVASRSLQDLASVSLCSNHVAQTDRIIRDWTSIMRSLEGTLETNSSELGSSPPPINAISMTASNGGNAVNGEGGENRNLLQGQIDALEARVGQLADTVTSLQVARRGSKKTSRFMKFLKSVLLL